MGRKLIIQIPRYSDYTYTPDTIIQAGHKNIKVTCVPNRVNEDLRLCRLVKSITQYVKRSVFTMMRIAVIYRPSRFFITCGMISFSIGVLIGIRFLWYFFNNAGQGMMQSLLLASLFLLAGFMTCMIAFVADLLAVNRKLLEDIQYSMRVQKLSTGVINEKI